MGLEDYCCFGDAIALILLRGDPAKSLCIRETHPGARQPDAKCASMSVTLPVSGAAWAVRDLFKCRHATDKADVMPRYRSAILAIVCLAAGTACVSIAPVPGAEQVKITTRPSDVATCRVVGNIKVPTGEGSPGGATLARIEFRNQAVGLGGNTALVTVSYLGAPLQGTAYHCDR